MTVSLFCLLIFSLFFLLSSASYLLLIFTWPQALNLNLKKKKLIIVSFSFDILSGRRNKKNWTGWWYSDNEVVVFMIFIYLKKQNKNKKTKKPSLCEYLLQHKRENGEKKRLSLMNVCFTYCEIDVLMVILLCLVHWEIFLTSTVMICLRKSNLFLLNRIFMWKIDPQMTIS